MTITIDLRDQVKVKAKRNKVNKYLKTGLKIGLYGYIGTRLILGGIDAIIAYGKATAIFKCIDIVAYKIIR
jgi:hypothetical protein